MITPKRLVANVAKIEDRLPCSFDYDEDTQLQITENFRFGEFLHSEAAKRVGENLYEYYYNNFHLFSVNAAHLFYCLQYMRDYIKSVYDYEVPFVITSGLRSPGCNRLVGGCARSCHLSFRAADFTVKDIDNPEILSLIYEAVMNLTKHFSSIGDDIEMCYLDERHTLSCPRPDMSFYINGQRVFRLIFYRNRHFLHFNHYLIYGRQ